MVGERLRKCVKDQHIQIEQGQISITLSAGVTSMDVDENQTLDEMLKIADQALYSAKQAGRNCVRYGGDAEI